MNGKEPKTTRSLWLDVKVASSWKGPELERALKVHFIRGSEVTLRKGWDLQMPIS